MAGFTSISDAKIDNMATLGLLGVENSLSYRLHEVEQHLHGGGSWFGVANTPTATHKADRIGTCLAPFQMDGGDSSVTPTWGAWVQVLGSEDTPARAGRAYFDPHLMLIEEAEQETTYMIQFSRGATGDAGVSAGTYTEFCVGIDATKKFKAQTPIQTGRAPVGSLLWARCIAVGANTGTMDFYLGIHEYQG